MRLCARFFLSIPWNRRTFPLWYICAGFPYLTTEESQMNRRSFVIALAGVTGVAFALCFTILTALIQDSVPDSLRGRVMSIHMLAHLGTRPFVALAAGSAAALVGGPLAIAAFGVVLPVAVIWSARSRVC